MIDGDVYLVQSVNQKLNDLGIREHNFMPCTKKCTFHLTPPIDFSNIRISYSQTILWNTQQLRKSQQHSVRRSFSPPMNTEKTRKKIPTNRYNIKKEVGCLFLPKGVSTLYNRRHLTVRVHRIAIKIKNKKTLLSFPIPTLFPSTLCFPEASQRRMSTATKNKTKTLISDLQIFER